MRSQEMVRVPRCDDSCLTTFEMTALTIVCLLCLYSYLHSESKESYNQGCERPSDQGLLSRRLRAQEDATEHQEENWYLYPYSNLVRRHQAVLRCQHAQISHWQHDHWRHRGKSRGYWLKYDHRNGGTTVQHSSVRCVLWGGYALLF